MVVNATYTVVSWAGTERKTQMRNDRRNAELTQMLSDTLNSVIQCQLYPRSEVTLNVTVESQDGGSLAVAVNACTLALIDAGVPLTDYVCACTIGVMGVKDDTVLVDVLAQEERAVPICTVAMLADATRQERVVTLSVDQRVHFSKLQVIEQAALKSVDKLYEHMDAAVRQHVRRRIEQRDVSTL